MVSDRRCVGAGALVATALSNAHTDRVTVQDKSPEPAVTCRRVRVTTPPHITITRLDAATLRATARSL